MQILVKGQVCFSIDTHTNAKQCFILHLSEENQSLKNFNLFTRYILKNS